MENKNISTQKSIISWIKAHPLFKWSAMCKDIGLDYGNFHRTMSTGYPTLKEPVIKKITKILSKYGYEEPVQKAKSAKGMPLPSDFVHPNTPIGIIDGTGNKIPIVSLNDLNEKAKPKVTTAPKPKSNFTINNQPGNSKADKLRGFREKKP